MYKVFDKSLNKYINVPTETAKHAILKKNAMWKPLPQAVNPATDALKQMQEDMALISTPPQTPKPLPKVKELKDYKNPLLLQEELIWDNIKGYPNTESISPSKYIQGLVIAYSLTANLTQTELDHGQFFSVHRLHQVTPPLDLTWSSSSLEKAMASQLKAYKQYWEVRKDDLAEQGVSALVLRGYWQNLYSGKSLWHSETLVLDFRQTEKKVFLNGPQAAADIEKLLPAKDSTFKKNADNTF